MTPESDFQEFANSLILTKHIRYILSYNLSQMSIIHLCLYFDSEIFGLRVVNVYDVDNKTYLIKLSRLGQN